MNFFPESAEQRDYKWRIFLNMHAWVISAIRTKKEMAFPQILLFLAFQLIPFLCLLHAVRGVISGQIFYKSGMPGQTIMAAEEPVRFWFGIGIFLVLGLYFILPLLCFVWEFIKWRTGRKNLFQNEIKSNSDTPVQ